MPVPNPPCFGRAMNERMRDAAFAVDISQSWSGAVAGYYGGPNAFNVWAPESWALFGSNRKLPIWVAGLDGSGEGANAVSALRALRVPTPAYTAVDMESRVDKTYLDNFGNVLQ